MIMFFLYLGGWLFFMLMIFLFHKWLNSTISEEITKTDSHKEDAKIFPKRTVIIVDCYPCCCCCHHRYAPQQVNIHGVSHGSTFVEVDMPGMKVRVASFGNGQYFPDTQRPYTAKVVRNEPTETASPTVQRKPPFFRKVRKAICGPRIADRLKRRTA